MKIIENKLLTGTTAKEFGFDLYLPTQEKTSGPWPILVFAHGFKGFKDWGHWQKIAESFAAAGFAFLKFNFSHNGTNPNNPAEFSDLEAFGQNNFSKELADMQTVLDWLSENAAAYHIDESKITLIGHSRGGPIALLTAARDLRVASVITWASVHELDYAWQSGEKLTEWQQEGVLFSPNVRTGQQMPMYYQLYEDFVANAAAFSVKNALAAFSKPMLIVHGTSDLAVKVESAEYLKAAAPHAKLLLIEGADHVFGGKHPFAEETLPTHSMLLVGECLAWGGKLKS